MYELHPYFTNDGSVGLFSPEADDIYHSTYGALSEAYEKFVLPANLENFFSNNSEIKVLDICYGIGYNSKSFLNFLIDKKILNIKIKNKNFSNKIFEKFSKKIFYKKQNIVPIHTDNISKTINSETIDTYKIITNDVIYSDNNSNIKNKQKIHSDEDNNASIYSNNVSDSNSTCSHLNKKIFIKAIDTDKNLFYLSPFFRQGNKSDKKYNKLDFNYEKISKLLNNDFSHKYKLNPEVNLIILKNIVEKIPEIFEDFDFLNILKSRKYSPFFDRKIKALFWGIKYERGIYRPPEALGAFLHNIYYKYISIRYKKALNSLILNDFIFEPSIEDARTSLKRDENIYNFIFLDAFTPAKCPALWSLEFFKLLFDHLDNNGMILTYSNSSAVRNAMINAGFSVGKIYNPEIDKFTGTIAVKNKSLIKYELSEYDLGLINSRAGIFYRDENLNLPNEAIIEAHKKEVALSDKISSSAFIKNYKKQTKEINQK